MNCRGPTGLSTAADVAKLSIYAMRKPGFTFIVRQKDRQVTVHGAGGKRSFKVKNTNELVGEPMILGVKTGTTDAAGALASAWPPTASRWCAPSPTARRA